MSAEAAVSRALALCDSEPAERLRSKERRTVSVVRSSCLVLAADRILALLTAAWQDSFAGTISRQAKHFGTATTAADRLRLVGVLTVVASATALAIQRLASRPAPLVWMVPALCLLVGTSLIAVAREGLVRRP